MTIGLVGRKCGMTRVFTHAGVTVPVTVVDGTMKRHNFDGGMKTHGNSLSHRAPGSIGQRQTAGRVFKGKRMSGHMGVKNRTIDNLKIVEIDVNRNLLLISGAIPGSEGGRVIIRPSLKAASQARPKPLAPNKAPLPANARPRK